MGRSQHKGVKGLINARSVVQPESQFLGQKQGRLAKRDLKTTAVTLSPLKMPDSQDPEVQIKAPGCVRLATRGSMNCGQLGSGRTQLPFPNDDSVEKKVSASSHAAFKNCDRDLVQSLRQPCHVFSESLSEAGLYIKSPCVFAEETDTFDCEVPRVIKNRAWYIYTVVRVPPDEQSVTTVDEAWVFIFLENTRKHSKTLGNTRKH